MRRYLLFTIGVLSVTLVVVFAHPYSRWHFIGLIQNDEFFQRRPTSYWRAKILQQSRNGDLGLQHPVGHNHRLQDDRVELIFGLDEESTSLLAFQPAGRRVDAIPVLIQLLGDSSPVVRAWALFHVGAFGVRGKRAGDQVASLRYDSAIIGDTKNGNTIGKLAREVLIDIDPHLARIIGLKPDPGDLMRQLDYLTSELPTLRLISARRLYHLSYVMSTKHMVAAKPILKRFSTDMSRNAKYDRCSVGELCSSALVNISKANRANADPP